MKKTPMIIGIVLLILCVGGYFGVKAYNANEEKKEAAKTMTPIEIAVSDITGLSYVYEGTTLTFHKDGENWVYSDDTSIDINEETVDGMLEAACGVTSTQMVTAENLSDYGFDTPEMTISLTTAEGTTEIVIGMYNEVLSQYYMNINGSLDMYLVDSTLKTSFGNTLENLTVVETEEETESTEAETSESTETESTGSESAEGTETETAEGESVESESAEGTETETVEAESTEATETAAGGSTEVVETGTVEGESTEGTENGSAESESTEATETESVESESTEATESAKAENAEVTE